ncbi:MAG: 23S rRNA (pseudouridine(1915)-N(3))-methyltransferase RlmH [Bacillota bacterium]
MIKLNIVAVGKLKEKFWKDAIAEYSKRISRYADIKIIEVAEVADEGASSAELQCQAEAAGIIKNIKGCAVLMDIGGTMVTSEQLSTLITDSATEGQSELTFIIGGSRGVSSQVRALCKNRISFGRVTYPHQLMRVILTEQLYRAMTISVGASYHK